MKRYRVLKDCSGFRTANSPRNRWFKDELIYTQDNENPPEDSFIRVENPIDVLAAVTSPKMVSGGMAYSQLQKTQRELAEPRTGFAANIAKIESKKRK